MNPEQSERISTSEKLADASTLVRPPGEGLLTAQVAVGGLQSGSRFGDYEILGEIARGGMGVVCKARQVALGRIVALKMILAGKLASHAELSRFQLEARAAGRLHHPNIVAIYEVGSEQEIAFFSMEFVEGPSLAQRLQRGVLRCIPAARLVRTLALAIQYAHDRGVLHRDLKPANVLLDATRVPADISLQSEAVGEPKIADFGLAKHVCDRSGEQGLTGTGQILGTPSYMAPEQANGKTQEIGPATDVYGLGAILYECLVGRPPFKAENPLDTILLVLEHEPVPPRIFDPKIDADLERICLKCLAKEPADRYASAAELAADLERFLHGEPVQARSVPWFERVARELTHARHEQHVRPWGHALVALAGLLLICGLATSMLLQAGWHQTLAFWIPRSVLLALALALLWRFKPAGRWLPSNPAERLIWATWVGYILAFISVNWAEAVHGHHRLQVYGVETAVSGLAWFVMGGHVWGWCYLIGSAFFVLAPLMALIDGSVWAPACFGLLWAAALGLLGGRFLWPAERHR